VAEKLFAEKGINGVGVREIVNSAGHKNMASLRYHFGSKEKLIREIIVEGVRASEQWRIIRLDRLEQQDAEITIRDILLIIVGPVLEEVVTPTFMAFMEQVSLADRAFYEEAVRSEIQVGMRRCTDHLRRLAQPKCGDQFDDRMALFSLYVMAYQNVYSHGQLTSKPGPIWATTVEWRSPRLLVEFLDTAEALLTLPPTVMTAPALRNGEDGGLDRSKLASRRARA
jgi:AcrR family transcriptional regulator